MPRALVVDDDADIRAVVCLMLSRAGHEIVEAIDGADALEQLKTAHFDVVVLDVEMPRMTGLDVLAASVHLPRPRPPVVMLSALSSSKDAARALAAGADAYLVKPFRGSDLLVAVERAIEGEGP